MSIKIMAEVWEHSQAKGSELLLLLALADHADSVHAQCWPAVQRLALLIRMSERNTQYLLRKLEADGHIAIQLRGSSRRTNLYRIHRPWCKDYAGHKCADANGCTEVGATAIAPDPKVEPKPKEREKTYAREEGGKPQVTKVTEEEVASWLTPGSALWYFVQGLTPPGEAWEAALQGNGHHRKGTPIVNGMPCRL
jgi:hypothetical protein